MDQPADQPGVLHHVSAMLPRRTTARVRFLCLTLVMLCVAGLAKTAMSRIAAGAPDFEYFYKAGRSLLEHGSLDAGYDLTAGGQVVRRGRLEWYLPFVPRMLTLIAWLPQSAAGAIWLSVHLAALLASLRLAGQYLAARAPWDWPATQLIPFLLLAVFWYWEFRLNQINTLTLFLLLAGYVSWEQRRHAAAGVWLGLAVLIKIAPVLLVLWFGLKRQFRVVAVAVLTIVLAGPLADVIVFGRSEAIDRYRAWVQDAATAGSHRGLILSQTEMDWRNQGLGAVLSRWLHPTNYALHWDNDPRLYAPAHTATMNLANLPRQTVAWITTAIQVAGLLALGWLGRRPARALTSWQVRAEWALFVLAMLWFMPVLRAYHLIWLLPALSVLGSAATAGTRTAWSIGALACMFSLIPVQMVLRWTLPQAGGLLLASVVLLAVPLILMILRSPVQAAKTSERAPGEPGRDALPSMDAAKTHA